MKPRIIKLSIPLAVALASFVVTATQEIRPLVTAETLVGNWEALPDLHPPLLFHMEINKTGDSYLVQVTVGDTEYVVRRLLSSEVKDGNIRLHFGEASSKNLRNVVFADVWIVGRGTALLVPDVGTIEGRFCVCNDVPPPGLPSRSDYNILLAKGAWTRDIGEASQEAEKAIKEKMSTPHNQPR
jgi:hypothetical protein